MGYRLDAQSSDRDSYNNGFHTCSILSRRNNQRIKYCLLFICLFIFIFHVRNVDFSFYTTPKLDIKTGMPTYPMEINNFSQVVDLYRAGLLNDSSIKPTNLLYANVDFLVSPQVDAQVGLLVIVKSARKNFRKRNIIRKTWGNVKYLQENALAPNLPTKVYFICGTSDSNDSPEDIEFKYNYKLESDQQDMIIAGFNDSYSNNTYKSIVAFKWALTEFGGEFKYLALFDDDIYVDMVNLGSFLRELKYKRVLRIASTYSGYPYFRFTPRRDNLSLAVRNIETGLYMGTVFTDATPKRNSGNKWYTSYEDYDFNMFPPYVPGAGMVFDYKGVSDMYYASHFVRHFWIDDVYLGIVAAKLGMAPLRAPNFHSLPEIDRISLNARKISETIILHGFECPAQLLDFWHKREFKDLIECPK